MSGHQIHAEKKRPSPKDRPGTVLLSKQTESSNIWLHFGVDFDVMNYINYCTSRRIILTSLVGYVTSHPKNISFFFSLLVLREGCNYG